MRFAILVSATILAACDNNPTAAAVQCKAIAQATPLSARIPLGTSIGVAATQEGGCPAPLIRNETPSIIQLDVTNGSVRVTGISIGEGRLRVRSGVDTLVSVTLQMTVFVP